MKGGITVLTYFIQELTQMAQMLIATYGFLAIGVCLSLCIAIPVAITQPWRD